MDSKQRVRIAFVLVWAGPWRPWINLFWRSCARNPEIDFLVFTETEVSGDLPVNVKVTRMGIGEIARRAGMIGGVAVEIRTAYKLCDFKSLYGLVFARELAGYSHWAYCDEDVFWGDVRRFLTDEICGEFDVISSCRCSVVGQLTLFKNTDEVCRLVMEIPGYWDLLREPGIHLLDETRFNSTLIDLEARGRVRVLRRQFQTHDVDSAEWTAWANRLELAETGRAFGPMIHGAAVWRDGRVFNEASGAEFAFFHFGSWKRRWALPRIAPLPEGVNGWQASGDGVAFELRRDAGAAARKFVSDYRRAAFFARVRGSVGRYVKSCRREFADMFSRVRRRARRAFAQ